VKAYAKGQTLGDAAIEAGYSAKNPHQSGYQALKQIKGRVPELMDELGLTDRALIRKYLVPLLKAKETKFLQPCYGFASITSKKEQYLALATNFKIFKDAWRNDVSHIGSKYLEDDADSIYRHVGRFFISRA
jgi:hypothetical protein